MRRKVIQLAGKTLVISLPSKWAKKTLINKGDELEITENAHSLVICPVEKKVCTRTVIDVSGLNASLVWHYLTAAYVKGIEDIDVRFSGAEIFNPRTKKMVKTVEYVGDVVASLIGMELVRYGDNFCVVKEISEVRRDEFETVLKRLFFTVTTFAEDVTKSVNEDNLTALKNSVQLEKTVNRLCLFCLRALNKGIFSNPVEIGAYTIVISMLEEIADVYAGVCAGTEKVIKSSELNSVSLLVKGLYDIFYNFNKKECARFYETCNDLKYKAGKKSVMLCVSIVEKCLSVLSSRIVLGIDTQSEA